MSGLGKLLRTTAFKISLAYLVVFTVFAGFILGYVGWNVRQLLDGQIIETAEAEVRVLSEQFRQGGMRRLVNIIDRRARMPGAYLYLVTGPNGEVLVGNAASLVPEMSNRLGWREVLYHDGDENSDQPRRPALIKVFDLPGGNRLLVGRDLAERTHLRQVIRRALSLSLGLVILLGGLSAVFIARRVLRRIDSMTETTQSIMAGNLNGRLAIGGTGDELDRLANNLNAMLDRIGELMTGLREVSDNIAHDLKTPLTRLRNGAEEALRSANSEADYRGALERMIEESDGLIRTFNALLMIARAESGTASEARTRFDLGQVLRNVAELYEPVAEEAQIDISVEAADGLALVGNAELLSQALANLIDNAIKYSQNVPDAGAAQNAGAKKEIIVAGKAYDGHVEITVADRGQGIPAADRERVFERFTRLDASREKPGSGLGLSLAAAITHFHGGRIRLEDNHPGLRVVLTLPAAA